MPNIVNIIYICIYKCAYIRNVKYACNNFFKKNFKQKQNGITYFIKILNYLTHFSYFLKYFNISFILQ